MGTDDIHSHFTYINTQIFCGYELPFWSSQKIISLTQLLGRKNTSVTKGLLIWWRCYRLALFVSLTVFMTHLPRAKL